MSYNFEFIFKRSFWTWSNVRFRFAVLVVGLRSWMECRLVSDKSLGDSWHFKHLPIVVPYLEVSRANSIIAGLPKRIEISGNNFDLSHYLFSDSRWHSSSSILVVFKNSKNTGLRPQICMIVRMLKSQCRIRRTPWTEIPIAFTCFRMGFVSSADFHRMCTWGHPEVSLAPSVLLALSQILALYPSFPSHSSHAKKPNRRTRNRSADAWKEYWTF